MPHTFEVSALKFLQKNYGLFVTFVRKCNQVWCDVFDNLSFAGYRAEKIAETSCSTYFQDIT